PVGQELLALVVAEPDAGEDVLVDRLASSIHSMAERLARPPDLCLDLRWRLIPIHQNPAMKSSISAFVTLCSCWIGLPSGPLSSCFVADSQPCIFASCWMACSGEWVLILIPSRPADSSAMAANFFGSCRAESLMRHAA